MPVRGLIALPTGAGGRSRGLRLGQWKLSIYSGERSWRRRSLYNVWPARFLFLARVDGSIVVWLDVGNRNSCSRGPIETCVCGRNHMAIQEFLEASPLPLQIRTLSGVVGVGVLEMHLEVQIFKQLRIVVPPGEEWIEVALPHR
jgi:hypothetical protein